MSKAKKFKSVAEIKAHYEKQIKPLRTERDAVVKEFKAKCRHLKKNRLKSREATKSEIFYDGYKPPGEPNYSYGHYNIESCSACGKELKREYKHGYDGR